MEKSYKVYSYRWVVLITFMLINLTIQMLWISYAPITGLAAEFYGVSDLHIGLLAMSFMIAFIPLSIPVSWAIDTFGFRISVSIGAAMMGIFGIVRGCAGSNYTLVLLCTFGIAAAQPFLLNAWTTVPAKWFAANQRATAVGLVTLGNLVGTAIGMVVTPVLVESGITITRVQLFYGIIAAVSGILFIIFAREKPLTPPSQDAAQTRALMFEGLKNALTSRRFWFSLAISFIGLGIFNGVTTWIEIIIRPRGFTPSAAGIAGAVMIAGGLFGAVIIPALSDKQLKRQRFLFVSFIGTIPGLLGLTFAADLILLLISSFVMGFFLVSALPIAMQYAAEVTHPTPEGTSNGLIQLVGQGAVIFVYIMEAMKTASGSFTPSLLLAVGLIGVSIFCVSQMKDKQKGSFI
ncbi:MAG: MFS transporter [Spirochaetales bacterium]|nr:MFS transporter [Spirochaetales bacterium]